MENRPRRRSAMRRTGLTEQEHKAPRIERRHTDVHKGFSTRSFHPPLAHDGVVIVSVAPASADPRLYAQHRRAAVVSATRLLPLASRKLFQSAAGGPGGSFGLSAGPPIVSLRRRGRASGCSCCRKAISFSRKSAHRLPEAAGEFALTST